METLRMGSNQFRIVLVRPRDPNNIGAVARAMKNFGFSDLAVVSPYMPVWDEAVSAVNAEDILKSAQVFDDVAEAINGFDLVAGTVDKRRVSVERRLSPEGLREETGSRKLVLLFGSEKTGLSNEVLSLCNRTVTIPTAEECPSMNLAQAVAVVCYELNRGSGNSERGARDHQLASHSEMEAALRLAANLVPELDRARLLVPLRKWMYRSEPSSGEIGMLCGLIKESLKTGYVEEGQTDAAGNKAIQ